MTVVTLHKDGTEDYVTRPLDPKQEAADVAAREAQQAAAKAPQRAPSPGTIQSTTEAITQDTGCGAASAWLYDKADGWNGGANKICFVGGGWANLCHPMYSATWCGKVAAVWPGVDQGTLTGSDFFQPPCDVHYFWKSTYAARFDVDPANVAGLHLADGVCNDWSPSGVCGSAGHGACQAGGPLPNSCHSCVAPVCATDPYCCNTAWDSVCINEAKAAFAAKSCNNPCSFE